RSRLPRLPKRRSPPPAPRSRPASAPATYPFAVYEVGTPARRFASRAAHPRPSQRGCEARPSASNGAVRAQPRDRRRIVAELLQDHISVLALIGGRTQFIGLWVTAHMDRLADDFLRSELGMAHRLGDTEMLHLRVGKGLVDRIDRSARHTGLSQQLDPISIR